MKLCMKSWFLCCLPTAALANYLQLLKLLEATGSPASKGTLRKLCGQLWYLSEELVAFAFFDRDVNSSEKKAMVKCLSHDGIKDPLKCISLDQSKIPDLGLQDLVTKNTCLFFEILTIPDSSWEQILKLGGQIPATCKQRWCS